MQRILSGLRRAVTDFGMIADGDEIAVGLSGGKDSLTLLAALKNYALFSPQRFHLRAVTVDMGVPGMDISPLADYCARLEVPYIVVPSEIYAIVFEERKETNPCSLCSKMRRGALNTAITSMGVNKLALGHHADDAVETALLSLFYEGRWSTFSPVSFMDRTGVTLIRPLIYTWEKEIRAFARTLPVVENPCPANKHTQRETMKNLLNTLGKDIPRVKERIFGAICNPNRSNLWNGLGK
ncbi:MAG: tRNA 2-thiocytidine(32) synthetase TtcA [Firmicutes bacterium]|nr:tRNA 2-thiocytidine(32) synthetase TtcA [Bacillota bacterium]